LYHSPLCCQNKTNNKSNQVVIVDLFIIVQFGCIERRAETGKLERRLL